MVTLGLIVGNRGFFPDHLCETGRKTVLEIIEKLGFKVVALPIDATKFGAVESLEDARKCAELFKANREQIDGVLVTLPNFGDERAVANALRWSGLNVPVLVHAFADDASHMTIKDRRDSFCGKMSVCNNLRQYGIPYSLTKLHTEDPNGEDFKADLQWFAAVCRVVRSLRNVRFGQIGARPAAFNTVRYSEKLLERAGISIETIDLSEILGQANRLKDDDATVQAKLKEIQGYTRTEGVPVPALLKMSRLGVAIEKWMKEADVAATAIQCWTSMEEFYGVVPCTLMSMMSNCCRSSACETDIAGLVGMHALQAASGRAAALLDWNNNYGADPDKGILFHCSNLPKDVFGEQKMDYQEIIAGTVGKENTFGTIVGRIQPGPFSYCRVSTDDHSGRILAYCGEGEFTTDSLETFGGYGVIRVPNFQGLLSHICNNGFEHHVAITRSQVACAVAEGMSKYLGWSVYCHS